MANDTVITIVGNLTADPELRFTPSGAAVANLTVASTPRSFDKNSNEWKDGEAIFMRCSVWRDYAENVAETLHRGDRVIVTGRLRSRSYEHEGQKRTSMEMEIDEIGPALRYASARVTKAERSGGGGGGAPAPAAGGDPWATPAPGAAPPQWAGAPAPAAPPGWAGAPAPAAPAPAPAAPPQAPAPAAPPAPPPGGWAPAPQYDQPPY